MIERLNAWLIQDDAGKPLGTVALRSRFDKARAQAGVDFLLRDIRAKAATHTGDLAHSQKLRGHRNREMPEHYVRSWGESGSRLYGSARCGYLGCIGRQSPEANLQLRGAASRAL